MIGLKNSFEIAYNGTENECRFELYADTADDLQGLTHFDGIKIQMGSECSVIATGEKYLLDGSGVWVLQPSANAWENVYTKSEIDTMITTIYQYMMYYHTTQTSADGTITFYAFAGFVGSLTIYGNGSQQGTPTPDNPVMPEFVGTKTANLLYLYKFGYSISQNGVEIENNVAMICKAVSASGTYYTVNFSGLITGDTVRIHAYTGDTWIEQIVSTNINQMPLTFITPENTDNIRVSIRNSVQNLMLNTGGTALPYEPFGWAEKITCAGQTVPVYLGQTQTVRKIRKLVLDGTEEWQTYAQAPDTYSVSINDAQSIGNPALCSHFENTPISTISSGKFTVGSTWIYIRYADVTDVTDFKSYLAAQYAAGTPVTVWYALATEQTGITNEPLCKIGDYADELHSEDAGVSIPTVSGENTLTVDTELPPSKIIISGER